MKLNVNQLDTWFFLQMCSALMRTHRYIGATMKEIEDFELAYCGGAEI